MTVTVKVKLNQPCKLWTNYINKRWGYGVRGYKGKVELAHRVAYAEHHGLTMVDIKGVTIRHQCDTPACIEPTHLIAGTHTQNMKDMVLRGRSLKGEKQPNSKLTTDQVRVIKQRLVKEHRIAASLAREYGVHPRTIHSIKRGENWKHI